MTTPDPQTAPPATTGAAPDGAPGGAPDTSTGGAATAAPSVESDDKRQSFDRDYVLKLRDESAGYRVKAKRADDLAGRLVTSYAASTGKLADASDLPYADGLLDEHGLPDEAKVREAVDALLTAKPHLASRRPAGDVGQGARPGEPDGVSVDGLLRAGAG